MIKPKILVTFLLGTLAFNSSHATHYVYISNKQDGTISSFKLNDVTGKLIPTPSATTQVGNNVASTIISPDHQYLYAITRDKPYFAKSFKIDQKNGNLKLHSQTSLASSYTYASADKTGQYMFSASYDDDLITVHKTQSGIIQEKPLQNIRTQPNTHAVIIDQDNKYLYATSLSGQVIHQYQFNHQTGEVASLKPATVAVDHPMTPRHLVVSKNNNFIYIIDETAAQVLTYQRDKSNGQLRKIAVTDTLFVDSQLKVGRPRGEWRSANLALKPSNQPQQDIWAADIHLTPDNHFLYISERTSSTLTLLKIDNQTGIPHRIKSFNTEQQPRAFSITPNGKFLLSTGEKSTFMSVFNIDQQTGELALNDRYPVGKNPLWVSIIDIQ